MKKIGIFPMVADLLHVGHLKALEHAKSRCDFLIVALNVNPTADNPDKEKPVESVYERYTRLKACRYVDQIIPYEGEEDLMRLLQTTNYHIRFVGADHQTWTGKDYEESTGKEYVIIPRDHNLSSTNLRERLKRR